jgi:glutamyl-tRNA reductase
MNIAVVGLSHKTAPVEVREKLSIPTPQVEAAIAQLCSYPHIQEATILSTCNRLEIYIVTTDTDSGMREVGQFLSEYSKLPLHQLRRYLFLLLHQDAVMHLMRVSAGLDSLVLGEGQILAQVKHTHKIGRQHNGIGRVLNKLFTEALAAGKRVRTETSIGTGAVSISSAAVELAQVKAQNLAAARVAIIGAGKMARLLVQHLLSKGAHRIAIVNRSIEGAKELAAQFPHADLQLHTLSDMMSVIAHSDIAFTSTAATEPLLDRAKLEATLDPSQPLMLFDISVPRNVDGDVNELAQVQAFNVDDLKAVVAQNQESRRQMALEAEGLLEEAVDEFDIWWRSQETTSTIVSLRNKMETIRSQELEKALSRLGTDFTEKHQAIVEALTVGIINKILHHPMEQLKMQRDLETRQHAMETLQVLFNLETASSDR